jgi:hypothetical protein
MKRCTARMIRKPLIVLGDGIPDPGRELPLSRRPNPDISWE